MGTFSLVVMIVAVLGVVVLILLFERRRAQEIERDLQGSQRRARPREWEHDE